MNIVQPYTGTNQLSRSTSCIEDLPNEIFYEIFEYLTSYHINQAFSNLNIRFENLLTIYSPIKIEFSSQSEQCILPNRHKIISLSFYEESDINLFFTLYTLDSSFNHLQSVILKDISSLVLISLSRRFYLLDP